MAAAAGTPSRLADPMPPPPPPPIPTTAPRPRRRGREVSSRYLSTPVPSTPRRLSTASSTSTRSRSPSPTPHRRERAATPMPFANENHPPPPRLPSNLRLSTASSTSTRSRSPSPSPRRRERAATPMPFANENHPPPPPRLPSTPRLSTASSTSTRSRSPSPSPRRRERAATPMPFANENHPPPPPLPTTGTVARRRAVQKLFDETGGGGGGNPRASVGSSSSSAMPAATPRPLPRSTSGPTAAPSAQRGYPRLPMPARAGSCPTSSEAVESDAASCCSSSETSSTATDFSGADAALGMAPAATCESPTLLGPASCRGGRLSSELRSSVPESGGSSRASNPLCYRSLNSALSTSTTMSGKFTAAGRPPQPQAHKAAELKKVAIVGGRKVVGKPEDVHQLRMMDNSYLQYRFINARAEAASRAKATAAEESLYGHEVKIASLRVSVPEKRAELERMKREHRLSSVLNAQVPYLNQWSDIEEGHASCLGGASTALYNALLRLPVMGNVNANCEELKEVLHSATQLLEPLSPCIENFLPKVEQIDDVACNLAQVIATERTLIEECGNLLYQAQNLQMRESSLRSQVMQLKQRESSLRSEVKQVKQNGGNK